MTKFTKERIEEIRNAILLSSNTGSKFVYFGECYDALSEIERLQAENERITKELKEVKG